MKTLLKIIACAVLGCGAARAGEGGNGAPTVDTQGKGNVTGKVFEPTRKSEFAATGTERDPFWPIGWTKPETGAGDVPAPETLHATDFSVTSILLNQPAIAVVNGREMAEGEVAAFIVGGQQVYVQLAAVLDGRVILRWQGKNLVVPLHRDEDALTGVYNGQPATALR